MQHKLIPHIQAYIKMHQLFSIGDTIIIGLSGGPDSVCLTHVLAQLQSSYSLTLIAAHLDHQWRRHSEQDILFCKQLAQQLDIEFVSTQASELAVPKKTGSLEEQGRRLRRSFFEQLASDYNAHHIALAHHEQDQIETFFIRLMRGSSLTGLGSMRPKQGLYIRPLLNTTKKEIYRYLDYYALPSIIDPTNQETTQLRNRIRHIALPALKKTDMRFFDHTIQAIHHIQAADDFIDRQTTQALATCTTTYRNTKRLDLNQFFLLDEYLHKRILIKWLCIAGVQFTLTTSFLNEIIRYLQYGQAASHQLSPDWKIEKKSYQAIITATHEKK